jgi:hypothetical protein
MDVIIPLSKTTSTSPNAVHIATFTNSRGASHGADNSTTSAAVFEGAATTEKRMMHPVYV